MRCRTRDLATREAPRGLECPSLEPHAAPLSSKVSQGVGSGSKEPFVPGAPSRAARTSQSAVPRAEVVTSRNVTATTCRKIKGDYSGRHFGRGSVCFLPQRETNASLSPRSFLLSLEFTFTHRTLGAIGFCPPIAHCHLRLHCLPPVSRETR